jgi:hypothetical protein
MGARLIEGDAVNKAAADHVVDRVAEGGRTEPASDDRVSAIGADDEASAKRQVRGASGQLKLWLVVKPSKGCRANGT